MADAGKPSLDTSTDQPDVEEVRDAVEGLALDTSTDDQPDMEKVRDAVSYLDSYSPAPWENLVECAAMEVLRQAGIDAAHRYCDKKPSDPKVQMPLTVIKPCYASVIFGGKSLTADPAELGVHVARALKPYAPSDARVWVFVEFVKTGEPYVVGLYVL